MKITTEWLKEKLACDEGIMWFSAQKVTDGIGVLKALMKDDKFQWENWLVCRLMDKPNCVRYAIFAAEQVIAIYEKRHPKDDRPRKAIAAAQAWVDNPTEETRRAADAAYAAYAARSQLQLKILKYGISLLEKGD